MTDPIKTIASWAWFWLAQLIMLVMMVLGWFVLLPACLLHFWKLSPKPSVNDGRVIDEWALAPLNWIWGNPEDGVSAEFALVWIDSTTRGAWRPEAPVWLRAYAWSACRNSTDSLKYSLALGLHGPTFSVNVFGRTLRGGWSVENGLPVLVLSWRR